VCALYIFHVCMLICVCKGRTLQHTSISTNIKGGQRAANLCLTVCCAVIFVWFDIQYSVQLFSCIMEFFVCVERLDFSCAIFSSDGGLVANAPHLPVHLGAMQVCMCVCACVFATCVCAGGG